jgi:hypothetical protein
MAQRNHRIRVSFLCIRLGLFLLLTLGWSHARATVAEEQEGKQQPATKQEAPQQQPASQGQEAEQTQTPKTEVGVPGPIRYELTSRVELKYEQIFLKESAGQVYRILLVGSYAFSNMSFGVDELPIIKIDTPGLSEGFALGDLILRGAWVPYVSPSGNFGIDLVTNLTLPTGDFDKGLGAGRYALEPRLFLPYRLSQSFTIAPAIYYMFTLAKQQDLAQDVSLLTFRLMNFYYPSTKSYVLVEPRLYYDFEARKVSGELRFQLGTLLTRNILGSLEYEAGLGVNRPFDGKIVAALRYFFR